MPFLIYVVGQLSATPESLSGPSRGGWLASAPLVSRPVERSRVCLDVCFDDLPIHDVLQLLAAGRKTGYLAVQTSIGSGALVFHQVRVVASIHDGDGGPLPAADGVSSSEAEREG